jgi:hypothetical protein
MPKIFSLSLIREAAKKVRRNTQKKRIIIDFVEKSQKI